METCVRGFSYMCDKKETMELHYIEEDELERTWKNSRRERKKLQEAKIWEEFLKEKDIVSEVYQDDQYQFLDELPDTSLKDMMDTELDKIKKEVEAEEEAKGALVTMAPEPNVTHSPPTETPSNRSNSDEENQHTCVVSFADVIDCADEMFHIYHDEREELSDPEGENEVLNRSDTSLPTVRERKNESPIKDLSPNRSTVTSSTGQSSNNFSNVIESSIYCAKVRELRTKINAEILNMITALDRRDIFAMEQEEISRMIKRSAEFCNRFNRIYIYQLQRQMQDIKRNDNLNLPFAKHTQFQSQMVRIVSLHLNLFQSFQVFRKSAEQSWCVRDSVSALGALIGAARAATAHCAAVKQPKNLSASKELYNDSILESCDKLEEFVNEYTLRCEEYLNSYETVHQAPKKSPSSKSGKPKNKKRPISNSVRSTPKPTSETESHLSMYSASDTLRLNTKPYGKVKGRAQNNINKSPKSDEPSKGPKKTYSSRRPLMRDPHQGRPRAPKLRPQHDHDVPTLVESVDTCPTPTRDLSPHAAPQRQSSTPRTPRASNGKEPAAARRKITSPRGIRKPIVKPPVPKVIKAPVIKPPNAIMKNVEPAQITPVCKVQCAVKTATVEEEDVITEVSEPVVEQHAPIVTISPKSPKPVDTPRERIIEEKKEMERSEVSRVPDECEVSKLLKQLCSGDSSIHIDRTSGVRNAQLIHFTSYHSRTQHTPSTPQLLRILEETIQKKVPKSHYHKSSRNVEKHRLAFNLPEQITDNMFQYRTKFVQHMLTSPMYANCAIGKPWEVIGSVSEQIIDNVLLNCVKEMEIDDVMQEIVKRETT